MTRAHLALASIAALAGVAAAGGEIDGVRAARVLDEGMAYIGALDLGERIQRADPRLRVFDLRPRRDYDQLHVPTAVHVPPGEQPPAPWPPGATVVLYGDRLGVVARAWQHVRSQGATEVRVLREGIYEWTARVIEPRLAVDATPAERAEFERGAPLSRFFGGVPREWVARADVPGGYWTGAPDVAVSVRREAVAAVRRRGC